jgi:hypothetical protein
MKGATFTFTVPADGVALAQVDRSVLAARVGDLGIKPTGRLWAALVILTLAAGGVWLATRWRRERG